jgi:hypothetical protein
MHCTFFRGNQFSSFLLGRDRCWPCSREIEIAESRRTLFRGNHFYSFVPGETCAQEARRLSSPGALHFFRGNHFSSFLPADTSQPRQPVDLRRWVTIIFPEGTTFPRSLCFTDAFGRHLDFRQKFFL